ncbi:DENN (AEX3) domain containing protein, variant 2 [Balamuthia mandrillaris]
MSEEKTSPVPPLALSNGADKDKKEEEEGTAAAAKLKEKADRSPKGEQQDKTSLPSSPKADQEEEGNPKANAKEGGEEEEQKHLAQYFIVVGLDFSKAPTPYIEQKPILSLRGTSVAPSSSAARQPGPLDTAWKANVLARYPVKDRPNSSLPPHIWMFCYPRGVQLKESSPPPPLYFPMVTTAVDGSHLYGCCLTFYERMEEEEIAKFFSHIGEKKSSAPSKTTTTESQQPSSVDANNSELNKQQETKTETKELTKKEEPRKEGLLPKKLYAPKSICVLCKASYPTFLRDWLCELYAISQRPSSVYISSYVKQLLDHVFLPPSPGDSLRLTIGRVSPCLTIKPKNSFPETDLSLRYLFDTLDLDNVLLLFSCVLSEQKIVLKSSQYTLLTYVAESINSLLYPFAWQHVYVPVLPECLVEFMSSPTAFIMGVHSTLNKPTPNDPATAEVVVVDLDHNRIHIPEVIKAYLPPLPEPEATTLRTELRNLLYKDIACLDDYYTQVVEEKDAEEDDDEDSDKNKADREEESMLEEMLMELSSPRTSLTKSLKKRRPTPPTATNDKKEKDASSSSKSIASTSSSSKLSTTSAKASSHDDKSKQRRKVEREDTQELDEEAIRYCFLMFFVSLFPEYGDHVTYLRVFPDPVAIFNKRNFLRSRTPQARVWFETFLDTQLFSTFLTKHSWPTKNLFDDCLHQNLFRLTTAEILTLMKKKHTKLSRTSTNVIQVPDPKPDSASGDICYKRFPLIGKDKADNLAASPSPLKKKSKTKRPSMLHKLKNIKPEKLSRTLGTDSDPRSTKASKKPKDSSASSQGALLDNSTSKMWLSRTLRQVFQHRDDQAVNLSTSSFVSLSPRGGSNSSAASSRAASPTSTPRSTGTESGSSSSGSTQSSMRKKKHGTKRLSKAFCPADLASSATEGSDSGQESATEIHRMGNRSRRKASFLSMAAVDNVEISAPGKSTSLVVDLNSVFEILKDERMRMELAEFLESEMIAAKTKAALEKEQAKFEPQLKTEAQVQAYSQDPTASGKRKKHKKSSKSANKEGEKEKKKKDKHHDQDKEKDKGKDKEKDAKEKDNKEKENKEEKKIKSASKDTNKQDHPSTTETSASASSAPRAVDVSLPGEPKQGEDGCLSLQSYDKLAEIIRICLREANERDDFDCTSRLIEPLFYFHRWNPKTKIQDYIYQAVVGHDAWQNDRFWEKCFYDKIREDFGEIYQGNFRKHMLQWSFYTPEVRTDLICKEQSKIFDGLATFAYKMLSVGVSVEIIRRFVTKMSTISALNEEQSATIGQLVSNMTRAYEMDAELEVARGGVAPPRAPVVEPSTTISSLKPNKKEIDYMQIGSDDSSQTSEEGRKLFQSLLHTKTMPKGVIARRQVAPKKSQQSEERNYEVEERDDYIVKTLTGHQEGVLCVKACGNSHVLSGSCDGTVKLWDAFTTECLHTFTGHRGWVNCIEKEEDRLLSGSYDSNIKLWDLEKCSKIRTYEGHEGSICCLQTSMPLFASGSYDNSVRLWDIRQGKKPVQTFTGHTGPIECLQFFDPKGTFITGSRDTTLRLWEARTGKCFKILKGHRDWVKCVSLDESLRFAYSGSCDAQVIQWNLITGKPMKTMSEGRGGSVNDFCFMINPNAEEVSETTSHSNRPSEVSELLAQSGEFPKGRAVRQESLSKLGKFARTKGADIKKRTMRGRKRSASVQVEDESSEPETPSTARNYETSEDESDEPPSRRAGSVIQGMPSGRPSAASLTRSTSASIPSSSQKQSPVARKMLISGSARGLIKVWNAENGSCTDTLRGHKDEISHLKVFGRTKVVSASYDGMLKVWDIPGKRCVCTLHGHTHRVYSVDVHESRVISGCWDRTVKIWDFPLEYIN